MFPQQPLQQFRKTNADVQIFYEDSTWNKPTGCGVVYMMLIGAGSGSGGSGAVTVWFGAARNVPDSLVVTPGVSDTSDTTVSYRGAGGLVTLLTGTTATGVGAAAASAVNTFTLSGHYKSTAGQAGGTSVSASGTTFLSGSASTGAVTANYGYATPASNNGAFYLQPVIVGRGGAGTGSRGGIGCGGQAVGGPGLVIIASW